MGVTLEMSDRTIYAFVSLICFSRYTTSLQTPGSTMKTLKCKYVAMKLFEMSGWAVEWSRRGVSLLPDPN